MASLYHPWFTTTNLSYRFPIFETSATGLCGTTGKHHHDDAAFSWTDPFFNEPSFVVVSIYIYIYKCICIHIHIYTHIHTYIHIFHTHTHIYVYMYIHIHINKFQSVVPRKAVAEVLKLDTYRREMRGWLLWITDGRANPPMDRKLCFLEWLFGVVTMVAVVTWSVTSPTTAGCSVV